MNSISIRAYAKINLALDVIKKRDDGYHELNMIMQSIQLYDSLYIRKTKEDKIVIKTNLPYIPVDHNNIVYKAASLFKETFNIKHGFFINIYKRIPVAAGLAGGSTDAAATIKGLNQICKTALTLDEMMKLGVKLGADVPYCMMMGTALSQGIGEVLTPLKNIPDCNILLVKPAFSVSTKEVYNKLKIDSISHRPDIPAIIKAIEKGSLSELVSHMDNVLQSVTINQHPMIQDIKKLMIDNGALISLMSGSGPSVFGLYENPKLAKEAYNNIKNSNFKKQVFLTKPYWP